MNIAESGADLCDFLGQAWWIGIKTIQPKCIYYLGPFICKNDANLSISSYIEDLESEFAQRIQTYIKRCKLVELTVCEDL